MKNYTPRLDNAIRVAAWAHRNQTRKGSGVPYVVHPLGVMTIAREVTDDEDALIACLLHDVLEDVADEYPEATMRAEFGDTVTDTVLAVTKDESIADWHERSRAYLAQLEQSSNNAAIIVACADKIHNLMSTLADHKERSVNGQDEIWSIFTTSKADQLWWYESVRALVAKKLPELPLLEQFDALIAELKMIVADE